MIFSGHESACSLEVSQLKIFHVADVFQISQELPEANHWRNLLLEEKNTKACENCNYLLGPYMPLFFFFSPCYEGVLSFTLIKDPVFRFILPNADKNTRISQNAWLDHYDSGKSHTCHINEQKTCSNCVVKSWFHVQTAPNIKSPWKWCACIPCWEQRHLNLWTQLAVANVRWMAYFPGTTAGLSTQNFVGTKTLHQ